MWKKGKNGGAIIKRAFLAIVLYSFSPPGHSRRPTAPGIRNHNGHPASLLKPVDKENGIVGIIKLDSVQHRVIGTTDLFILHDIPELSRK